MTLEPSTIVGSRNRCIGASFRRKLGQPWTLLVNYQLNADLKFLCSAGFHDPDYFAASFLGLILDADDVADFQFLFEPANAGSSNAHVLSRGVLMERLIVSAHAPHTYAQVQRRSRGCPRGRHDKSLPALIL